MSAKLEELKLDIEELNDLLQQATRQRNKDLISLAIRRSQTEASTLLEESQNSLVKRTTGTVSDTQKCYEVKLNNYGWDQTSTVVKLYVTLPSVHQLPKEAVACNFTKHSLNLRIIGLENKNYNLHINNLCEEINPENSSVKVKTDMVVVSLVKKVPKDWSHITGVEKRINESKSSSAPEAADDSDPGSSLINLMKKMYQDGNDEIKRTIAKAWVESQEKKLGAPDLM